MRHAAVQVPLDEPAMDSFDKGQPSENALADDKSDLRKLKNALTRCIFSTDGDFRKVALEQLDRLRGHQNVSQSNLRELEDSLIDCLALENGAVQTAADDLLRENGDSKTAEKLQKLIENNDGPSARLAVDVLLSLSWKHQEFAISDEGKYARLKTIIRALSRKRRPTRPMRALAARA